MRVTRFSFDWEKTRRDFSKFKAVPCPKEADRVFLLKVIALTQTTIPPFALWDALEAVKQIRPQVPIAYFRTVLRDNCRKADVNLDAALRTVRFPKNLSHQVPDDDQQIVSPIPRTIGALPPPDPPGPTAAEIMNTLARLEHADKAGMA